MDHHNISRSVPDRRRHSYWRDGFLDYAAEKQIQGGSGRDGRKTWFTLAGPDSTRSSLAHVTDGS